MTRLLRIRIPRHGRNRVAAILLVGVAAASLAAGASAYWTGPGAGSATTVLGSPDQLTLSPALAEAQLTPGHASSVAVLATNSNPYFVQIRSLALDTTAGTDGFDVDAGHAGCDTSVLHLAPQDNGGAGWRVPPRVASTDGTVTIGLSDALTMDASAASACQGATFTVHLVEGT